MLKKVVFIFLIFFAVLLQVSFLGVFAGAGRGLNLALVVALSLAYNSRVKEGYLLAFFGGFLLDLLNITSVVGLTSFLMVVSIIVWQLIKKLAAPRDWAFLLYAAVASFVLRLVSSYPWAFGWFYPPLLAVGGDILLAAVSLRATKFFSHYLFEDDHWQLDLRL